MEQNNQIKQIENETIEQIAKKYIREKRIKEKDLNVKDLKEFPIKDELKEKLMTSVGDYIEKHYVWSEEPIKFWKEGGGNLEKIIDHLKEALDKNVDPVEREYKRNKRNFLQAIKILYEDPILTIDEKISEKRGELLEEKLPSLLKYTLNIVMRPYGEPSWAAIDIKDVWYMFESSGLYKYMAKEKINKIILEKIKEDLVENPILEHINYIAEKTGLSENKEFKNVFSKKVKYAINEDIKHGDTFEAEKVAELINEKLTTNQYKQLLEKRLKEYRWDYMDRLQETIETVLKIGDEQLTHSIAEKMREKSEEEYKDWFPSLIAELYLRSYDFCFEDRAFKITYEKGGPKVLEALLSSKHIAGGKSKIDLRKYDNPEIQQRKIKLGELLIKTYEQNMVDLQETYSLLGKEEAKKMETLTEEIKLKNKIANEINIESEKAKSVFGYKTMKKILQYVKQF